MVNHLCALVSAPVSAAVVEWQYLSTIVEGVGKWTCQNSQSEGWLAMYVCVCVCCLILSVYWLWILHNKHEILMRSQRITQLTVYAINSRTEQSLLLLLCRVSGEVREREREDKGDAKVRQRRHVIFIVSVQYKCCCSGCCCSCYCCYCSCYY